ncbi:MAG: purine-nucleoside phosphorylase [bacterium]
MMMKNILHKTKCAIILGSGLSDINIGLRPVVSVPYEKLKGFKIPVVSGHKPYLDIVESGRKTALVFRGRIHGYECENVSSSYSMLEYIKKLDVRNILFTNAVGSVNPKMNVGAIVLVKDHINLTGTNPFMSGAVSIKNTNPFQDLRGLYKNRVSDLIWNICKQKKIFINKGVYAGVQGPIYETGAEASYLRRIGADVVGMSLVQEMLIAHFFGLVGASISFVTNNHLQRTSGSHEQVIKNAQKAIIPISKIISDFIKKI